ncbi:MAG: hypothetical protein JNK85_15100 [Verrucomicrobiales bacterium]|nr:hypothetical protein [Verrucomicrobiales bacterium]
MPASGGEAGTVAGQPTVPTSSEPAVDATQVPVPEAEPMDALDTATVPPASGVAPTAADAAVLGAGRRTEVRKDGKAATLDAVSEQAKASSGTPIADQGIGMKKGRKPSKAAEETLHILPVDRKGLAGGSLPTFSSKESETRRPVEVNRAAEEADARWATASQANPRWEPGRDIETVSGIRVRDYSTRVHQIEAFVAREAGVIRKSGGQSLSVVLRPDAQTELVVQLSQSSSGVEATIRCQRGEFPAARSEWDQLRDVLAAQNIRLAPPVEVVAAAAAADTGNGNGSRSAWSEERLMRGQHPSGLQQQSQQHQHQPQQQHQQHGSAPSRQELGYETRVRAGSVVGAGEKGTSAAQRPARRGGWESWA